MYQVSNDEYLKDLEKYHKWQELLDFSDKLIHHNNEPLDLAHYYKAVALHELRKLPEALETFDKAIKINPNNALFYNGKALLLRDLGRHEDAIVSFDTAFKKDPYMTSANINKAQTLELLNRREEALVIYEGILKKNTNLVPVLIFKAECLKELKRTKEALVAYDKAIEIEPNAPDLLNNKANILAQENRIKEAFDCYEKALQADPEFAHTYFNLGLLHHDQGKFKEAINYYGQALEYNVDGSFAYINRGICFIELKNYSQAEQELDKAMSIDPAYPFATYNRGILSIIQGKMHEAVILLRKSVKGIDAKNLTIPNIEQTLLDVEIQYNKLKNDISSKGRSKDIKIEYEKLGSNLCLRRNNYVSFEANIKELKARMDFLQDEVVKYEGVMEQFQKVKTTNPDLHEYLGSFMTLYNEFIDKLPIEDNLRKSRSYITKHASVNRNDLLRLFYIAGGESAADFVNKSISDPPSNFYNNLLTTMANLIMKKKTTIDIDALQIQLVLSIIAQLNKSDVKSKQITQFNIKKSSFHSFFIHNAIRTHPQIEQEINSSAKAIAVKDFILINVYFENNKGTLLTNEETFEAMFERIYRDNVFEDEKLMPIRPPSEIGSNSTKDLFQIKVLLENKTRAKSGSKFMMVAYICRDVPPNQINSPNLKWSRVYQSDPHFLTELINFQFFLNERMITSDYINTAAIKIDIVKMKSPTTPVSKGNTICYLIDLLNNGSRRFTFTQQNGFSKKLINVSVDAVSLTAGITNPRLY
jgi:tetratricopeptide (TPR) repeat protein